MNERVFERVSKSFKELCGMLLPSLSITLSKKHACASQGIEVTVQRNAMQIMKRDSDCLTGSLEQLSGGQRTLVSLALLLSAAQVPCLIWKYDCGISV